MSGESDNPQSVLETELETLSSIYIHELNVKHHESGTSTVSILLHPATADKLEEQYVRMNLMFKLPENYPEVIPEIVIQNTRGLSDEKIDKILHNLLDIAEARIGSFMLFELIQSAKEQLTAQNRPNEECAICLYGFVEADVFMKTKCYHYFHSHCLSRYFEYKIATEEDDEKNPKNTANDDSSGKNVKKVPCPVCRLEVPFSEFGQNFPKPIAMVEAPATVDSQTWGGLNAFEHLYKKQLAQGGIIDVEAESNKFRLEILSVPDKPDIPKSVEKRDPQLMESEVIVKKKEPASEGNGSTLSKSRNSPPKSRYLRSKQNEETARHTRSYQDGDKYKAQFNQNSRYGDSKFKGRYYNADKSQLDRSTRKGDTQDTGSADHKSETRGIKDRFQNHNRFPDDVINSASYSSKPQQFFEGRNNWNRYDSRKNYDRSYSNRFNQNRTNYGPNFSRDSRHNRPQNTDPSQKEPSDYRTKDKDNVNSSARNKDYNHHESETNDTPQQNTLEDTKEHSNEIKTEKKHRNYFKEQSNYHTVKSPENSSGHKDQSLSGESVNPTEDSKVFDKNQGENLRGLERDGENARGVDQRDGENARGVDQRDEENAKGVDQRDGENAGGVDQRDGENAGGVDQRDGENSRVDQKRGNQRGFNQRGGENPRRFSQRNSENPRGFNQRNSEYPRGFNQRNGEYPRGFNQRNGENPRGFNQRNGENPRGFNQRNGEYQKGFNQRNGENPRGFNQRNSENPRGFNQRNGENLREFNQRNGGNARGFNHRNSENSRGFNHRSSEHSRGFDQKHGENSRGFQLKYEEHAETCIDIQGENSKEFDQKHEGHSKTFNKEPGEYPREFQERRHGENSRGYDRAPRENRQFKDYSPRYQNNYHKNYNPGKFCDSQGMRNDKESSPYRTVHENYRNPSYADNRNRRYHRDSEELNKRPGAHTKYSNTYNRQLDAELEDHEETNERDSTLTKYSSSHNKQSTSELEDSEEANTRYGAPSKKHANSYSSHVAPELQDSQGTNEKNGASTKYSNRELEEVDKSTISTNTGKPPPGLEKHKRNEQHLPCEDYIFQQKAEKTSSENTAFDREFGESHKTCDTITQPPGFERHARNGLSTNHLLNEDSIFQQEECKVRVNDLKSSIPLNSLIAPTPSLPPGFANPSKKVIYGLPSFHTPPGLNLS